MDDNPQSTIDDRAHTRAGWGCLWLITVAGILVFLAWNHLDADIEELTHQQRILPQAKRNAEVLINPEQIEESLVGEIKNNLSGVQNLRTQSVDDDSTKAAVTILNDNGEIVEEFKAPATGQLEAWLKEIQQEAEHHAAESRNGTK